MGATVYTTAGGRRFHFDRACAPLALGRAIQAYRSGTWQPVPGTAPGLYPLRTRSALGSVLLGFTACRTCVPPALALPATGETYGHKPVTETGYYGPEVVCARCNRIGCAPYLSVPWPCTSAVVLGLAPRGGEA